MKVTKSSESKFLLSGYVKITIRAIIEGAVDLESGNLELSLALQ